MNDSDYQKYLRMIRMCFVLGLCVMGHEATAEIHRAWVKAYLLRDYFEAKMHGRPSAIRRWDDYLRVSVMWWCPKCWQTKKRSEIYHVPGVGDRCNDCIGALTVSVVDEADNMPARITSEM